MASIQRDHRVLTLRICTLLISTFLLQSAMLGSGQAAVTSAITPDGTMGTTVTQARNAYTISGGTITGGNLFHSFERFSIGTGGRATFTGPPEIANILGRVTGGEQSVIDGLLRSEIAGANLYLLNPSGILFGPHASLDVSGSFHVSTADFLRFADGAKFSANLGQESVLTVASPTAFGFLGSQPAAITIQGSSLTVSEGKVLSAVGGAVEILGGAVSASSGLIQLASVASPGEAVFSPLELAPDLQVHSFARLGRLTLSQGALVDASGNGGGTVLFRSGHLLVDRSQVWADNTGPMDGSGLGVDLRAADVVLANRAAITTDSWGAGRARDVRLTAGSVRMDNSLIRSRTFATGHGGGVALDVGTLRLTGGARLDTSSVGGGQGGRLTVAATDVIAIAGHDAEGFASGLFSFARGSGDGGRVDVSTPTLTMDEGLIATPTQGTGRAGDITIQAGRLALTGGASIDSGTGEVSTGQGGTVTITATDSVAVSGTRNGNLRSTISSTAGGLGTAGHVIIITPTLSVDAGSIATVALGAGRAGDITIQAGRLTLTGGASIESSTSSTGSAGTVTITATESVASSGQGEFIIFGEPHVLRSGLHSFALGRGDGGLVIIITPTLSVDAGGISTTSAGGAGRAGDVVIQAGRLTLTGGASIDSSSDQSSTGQGGTVTVTATESVTISGTGSDGRPSRISSFTLGRESAGRVTISTPVLVVDGGLITTATGVEGRAGNVEVHVGRLTLTGGATIDSSTLGGGQGGDIELRAQHVELRDGAAISARSTGDGNAGALRLQVGDTFRSENSRVTTAAERGGGGGILLRAGRLTQFFDSELTTSVRGGGGDAGNIDLNAPFIVLEGSQLIANAFEGIGGNIRLEAEVFLADPASLVSASSALGIQGTVDIRAPVTNLSGTLAPLPQAFLSAAALPPARCAARAHGGSYSSLVLGGRDGAPPAPGGLLPSPLALEGRLTADLPEIGDRDRQPTAAQVALLHEPDKAFPRLQGGIPQGGVPGAVGCPR